MEDPVLVRELGMSVVRSAEEQERKQGKDRQLFMLKMFCTLLELVTLRHRIIASASETEHLSQLSCKTILLSSSNFPFQLLKVGCKNGSLLYFHNEGWGRNSLSQFGRNDSMQMDCLIIHLSERVENDHEKSNYVFGT